MVGIDLKYDLSKYQIMVKVPFPDRSDKWILGKKSESREWYIYQTAIKLAQSYGRSNRAPDDYAPTYILDKYFDGFIKQNKDYLPDWFLKTIQPFELAENR